MEDTKEQEVLTEDSQEKTIENKLPKKTKAIFSRPLFASELFSQENSKKFDLLPSWERQFISKVIEHGNVSLAAKQAGVARHIKESVDLQKAETKTLVESLNHVGISSLEVAAHLKDCLEAQCVKYDKDGNPVRYTDYRIKLEALRLICSIRKDFELKKEKSFSDGAIDLFKELTNE